MSQTAEAFLGDAPSADSFLGGDEKPTAPPLRFDTQADPMNPDDGLVRSGRDFYGSQAGLKQLAAMPRQDTLAEHHWYDSPWQDFRASQAGHVLFGPTEAEAQASWSGAPGGNVGIVPIATSAPFPFLPGPETTAGKVLLSYFVASNLKSQPERIAEINRKFQTGDKSGAYHDILGDVLDTGMTALAAKDLHGESRFANPAERAAKILEEHADAADLDASVTTDEAARMGAPGRTPQVDAFLRQGMQPADSIGAPLVPDVTAQFSGVKSPRNDEVPGTPAEPERNLTALDEIRQNKAQTIAQIQNLFPKAELTREQARDLRNQAWGKPDAPPKATAEDFLTQPVPENEPNAGAPPTETARSNTVEPVASPAPSPAPEPARAGEPVSLTKMFGITDEQWRDMANYNDADQRKKFGTTRAQMLEQFMTRTLEPAAAPDAEAERPIPTAEDARKQNLPNGAQGAIAEYDANQKIIESGVQPTGNFKREAAKPVASQAEAAKGVRTILEKEQAVSDANKKKPGDTLLDTHRKGLIEKLRGEEAQAEEPKGNLSPMMTQYLRIKKGLPKDALLAFRLGDFYEFFFEDASTAADALKVAKTRRGNVDMTGVPYHAAEGYFQRLTKAGYKVAIVDTTEAPKPGQLAKREVTRIIAQPAASDRLTPEEQAQEQKRLAQEMGHEEETAQPATQAEPVKKASPAGKLRELADGLQNQIDQKRNPGVANQNPTARRARIAEGMGVDADRMERVQQGLRAIADAHDRGDVLPEIANVTTKAQVEELLRARYPHPFANPSVVRSLLKDMDGKPGIVQLRKDLYGVAYRDNGQLYGEREVEGVEKLVALAKKYGKGSSTYNIDVSSFKRLNAAGIEDEAAWNKARTWLIDRLQGKSAGQAKAEQLRKLENSLLGTDIAGFFPTPKPVAEDVVERADIQPGMKVLEPSAGKGDMADAARAKGAHVDTVEQNRTLTDILRAKGYEPSEGDFLQRQNGTLASQEYDRVVMNPPFENGQDVDHVQHAFNFLKPGGKLVAIMSEGTFFRNDPKARGFREWLERNGGTSEKMGAGSFTGKEAFRQTGVATRIVEVSKPEEVAKPVATPNQAAAKIEQHVEDVAKGGKVAKPDPALDTATGPRAAKEIKSELVDRLEKAIADAPSESPEFAAQKAKLLKEIENANNKYRLAEKKDELTKAYTDAGHTKTTIDIPGDGKFSIWNSKEALGEVLARARGLDTSAGVKRNFKETGISKADRDWVQEQVAQQKAALPRGEGGKIRPKQAAAAAEPKPEPAAPEKVNAVVRDFNRMRANIAPQTFSPEARWTGNLLRALNARMANEMLRADHALSEFRGEFDRTPISKDWVYDSTQPLPRNLAFVDAYENGRLDQLSPVERRAAEAFRAQNEDWLDRVQKLGTGALRNFYENYFPHIWEDPARAKQVYAKILAKSPLEGPKSFLRQRTHQLFVEGLHAGLKPVHDNPVDLWMLKKREVEHYVLARSFINTVKEAGLLKFVHSFASKPDGYSTVDDAAFTQWGPPTVTVSEAFDAAERAGMNDMLNYLGVSSERLARLSHKNALGLAYPPPNQRIEMKLGATEATAWHEMGHQLDWRFPDLRDRLKVSGNSEMAKQFRKFVDLRGEGQDVSEYQKRYFREAEEKIAEVVKGYIHAPELLEKTAPLVWEQFNQWLGEHPDIRDRLDAIKPRLAYGMEHTEVPVNGFVKLGEWMLPDPAARVVNNYLSPGLNPHLWYRGLRQASNLMNAAQLGLSAFHLGFTSLDAATSRLAVGIEDAMHGDLGRALKTIASVPVSPITNIMKGAKVRAEILRPGTQSAEIQQIAHAVEMAGGRVGQDAFWQTQFTRRMKRALAETRNNSAMMETADLRAVFNAPLALVEQAIRPIMEYVVPRQKLGVFADMAQREMERLGENAEPADVREAMRKAWDSVDNRMGQLVYDNMFYNRAVKDIALLSFRAYGWQIGKYREGLGAALDTGRAVKDMASGNRPEFTHRMAYAVALPMMVGLLGAITTYLLTGKRPEGQDYFMPPTGELDSNGNPVRLNFPSYMKDVLAYQKHPITSFGHSLNPLWSTMFDLYQNKDFYGVEIRHADDGAALQALQVSGFMAKQFVPFSVSGALKLREDAAPVQKQVLPFFGVTPAPSRMTMTPAQELASELMAQGMGDAPRTQEQFDRSKLIKDAARAIKSGKPENTKDFTEAIASGKLNPEAMQNLMDKLKYNPLQFQAYHLDARAAMRVWRVANAPERGQLQAILASKVLGSKSLTLEERQAYLTELTR